MGIVNTQHKDAASLVFVWRDSALVEPREQVTSSQHIYSRYRSETIIKNVPSTRYLEPPSWFVAKRCIFFLHKMCFTVKSSEVEGQTLLFLNGWSHSRIDSMTILANIGSTVHFSTIPYIGPLYTKPWDHTTLSFFRDCCLINTIHFSVFQ